MDEVKQSIKADLTEERRAALAVLGILTGRDLPDETVLAVPVYLLFELGIQMSRFFKSGDK